MLHCQATIISKAVSTIDSKSASQVALQAESPSLCSSCAKFQGCGMQVFDGLTAERQPLVRELPQSLSHLEAGDTVSLSLPSAILLRGVLLAYLLPLLLSLGGAILGAAISDGAAAGGLLTGLAAGYAVLRLRAAAERERASESILVSGVGS